MADINICDTDFQYKGETYEIRISLVGGDLSKGDFSAEAYLDGKKAFSAVRCNAMQAITDTIGSHEHPFNEIITMIRCNIKQGFNKA